MTASSVSKESVMPDEVRAIALDVARNLKIAQHIERRQYPEGDAPALLLPALLLSITARQASDSVGDRIRDVAEAVEGMESAISGMGEEISEQLNSIGCSLDHLPGALSDPAVGAALAGIETDLHEIAAMAYMWRTEPKMRGGSAK